MDGQLSAAHRSRQLLDLVDHEWMTDSLSDDDLHLPDVVEAAEELDDSAAVLTDSQGAAWSLSIGHRHSAASLARHADGGDARAISEADAAVSAALAPTIASTAANSVESPDGLRWTDLALAGFAATANRQPHQ